MKKFFKKNEIFFSPEIFQLQNLCFWANATCLLKVLFWIAFGFFFFPRGVNATVCSGGCNPVPVETSVSSFPAALATKVHGFFYLFLCRLVQTAGKSSATLSLGKVIVAG